MKNTPRTLSATAPTQIPFDQLSDSTILKKLSLIPDAKRGTRGIFPWSLSTLDKRIKHDSKFPKRVKLGERAVGFRVGDIRDYLASLEVK